jgi:hypothetical protein
MSATAPSTSPRRGAADERHQFRPVVGDGIDQWMPRLRLDDDNGVFSAVTAGMKAAFGAISRRVRLTLQA